jgi:hypothetical protein
MKENDHTHSLVTSNSPRGEDSGGRGGDGGSLCYSMTLALYNLILHDAELQDALWTPADQFSVFYAAEKKHFRYRPGSESACLEDIRETRKGRRFMVVATMIYFPPIYIGPRDIWIECTIAFGQ